MKIYPYLSYRREINETDVNIPAEREVNRDVQFHDLFELQYTAFDVHLI